MIPRAEAEQAARELAIETLVAQRDEALEALEYGLWLVANALTPDGLTIGERAHAEGWTCEVNSLLRRNRPS